MKYESKSLKMPNTTLNTCVNIKSHNPYHNPRGGFRIHPFLGNYILSWVPVMGPCSRDVTRVVNKRDSSCCPGASCFHQMKTIIDEKTNTDEKLEKKKWSNNLPWQMTVHGFDPGEPNFRGWGLCCHLKNISRGSNKKLTIEMRWYRLPMPFMQIYVAKWELHLIVV